MNDMKSVLLTLLMTVFSVTAMAQDFATRFMAEHKEDANLTCITISPTMMKQILKVDAVEKDEKMADVISNLKSMQLITAKVKSLHYFQQAMKIADKNSNRFDPYLASKDRFGESKVMVRRHKGTIVEMVMLTNYRKKFSVINFTGLMSDDFISQLTRSMKQKRS
jgi:hypothetical protein